VLVTQTFTAVRTKFGKQRDTARQIEMGNHLVKYSGRLVPGSDSVHRARCERALEREEDHADRRNAAAVLTLVTDAAFPVVSEDEDIPDCRCGAPAFYATGTDRKDNADRARKEGRWWVMTPCWRLPVSVSRSFLRDCLVARRSPRDP